MDAFANNITALTDPVQLKLNKCAIRCTAYDIAAILYKILKGHYRYIGKNKWEYYHNSVWQLDERNRKLRNFISTYVSDLFVKQYTYMFEHRNEYPEYADLCTNLLRAGYKLKSQQFISSVIKEARELFDYQNDDDD